MKSKTYLLLFLIFFSGCALKLSTTQKEQIKKELNEMAEIDQIAAYIPQGKYKEYTEEEWAKFKDSVSLINKIKAEKIFKKYGFPGFNVAGKNGGHDFWMVVQHSNKYPDFQKKVLAKMDKEVKRQNADPRDFAYLYDRVKVNAGEKQLFGTQLVYDTQKTGRAMPKIGLIDSVNIDKIRKNYGLGTLKEYLNQLTNSHFQMNKAHYDNIGVKSPYVY